MKFLLQGDYSLGIRPVAKLRERQRAPVAHKRKERNNGKR